MHLIGSKSTKESLAGHGLTKHEAYQELLHFDTPQKQKGIKSKMVAREQNSGPSPGVELGILGQNRTAYPVFHLHSQPKTMHESKGKQQ